MSVRFVGFIRLIIIFLPVILQDYLTNWFKLFNLKTFKNVHHLVAEADSREADEAEVDGRSQTPALPFRKNKGAQEQEGDDEHEANHDRDLDKLLSNECSQDNLQLWYVFLAVKVWYLSIKVWVSFS